MDFYSSKLDPTNTNLSIPPPQQISHSSHPPSIKSSKSAKALPGSLNTRAKSRVRRPHSKSRRGCLSCKKLRIKCDESRPKCEYCASTNKVCEYPASIDPTAAGSLTQPQQFQLPLPPATTTALVTDTVKTTAPHILHIPYSVSLVPPPPLRTYTTPEFHAAPIFSQSFTTETPSITRIETRSHETSTDDERVPLHRSSQESFVSKSPTLNTILPYADVGIVDSPGISEEMQTFKFYSSVKAPKSQAFRSIPYSEIHNFYVTHVSAALSLGEPKLYHIYSFLVPQIAFNCPMISHALIAYSALTMNKNRPERDPNLDLLAGSNFNAAALMLNNAIPNLTSARHEEIHITSCFIAAYAFIEPSVAPLISYSPNMPDLFGIMRGVYNLSNYTHAAFSNSILEPLFQQEAVSIPTLGDLAKLDTSQPNMKYYRLLLDQLNLFSQGSQDISFLCDPDIYLAPEQTCVPKSPKQKANSTITASTKSPSSLTDLQYLVDTTKSNPDSKHGDDERMVSSDPVIHSSDQKDLNHPSTLHTSNNSFSFLPGELQVYRVVVYSVMFLAQMALIHNRPTYLVATLNAPPDDYLKLLRQRRPMAQVIAAFILGQFAFMSAYPDYKDSFLPRLEDINVRISPEWRPALYW